MPHVGRGHHDWGALAKSYTEFHERVVAVLRLKVAIAVSAILTLVLSGIATGPGNADPADSTRSAVLDDNSCC